MLFLFAYLAAALELQKEKKEEEEKVKAQLMILLSSNEIHVLVTSLNGIFWLTFGKQWRQFCNFHVSLWILLYFAPASLQYSSAHPRDTSSLILLVVLDATKENLIQF